MCKQDVQMGRAMDTKPTTLASLSADSLRAIPARPARTGLSVVAVIDPSELPSPSVDVVLSVGGADVPVWRLNSTVPSTYLSVKDYGTAMLGPVGVKLASTMGVTVYLVEYFFDSPLEDV